MLREPAVIEAYLGEDAATGPGAGLQTALKTDLKTDLAPA